MAIDEVTKMRHEGKIRDKLTARGYYVTPLGLIMDSKDSEYILGDIKNAPRLIRKKKELVVIANVGDFINGKYRRYVNQEKVSLLEVLKKERIPHKLRDWYKNMNS
ncbi:MAG: hypothetical protein AABW47_02420 [Nanoarchaeota archaeon]